MLIDTHAHIDFEDYDLAETLVNAQNNGVQKIIIPGVEPETFDQLLSAVEKDDRLYGAIGVHPSEAQKYDDNAENRIKEILKNPKIVGIGEVGLDYYWDKSFVDLQKEIFIKQIEIANEFNKPLIVHERDAHADSFEILKKYAKTKVLFHCFSGSVEFAKQCINEGYKLAFGGVVTFKNAKVAKEVVKNIALENIMLETDSPYLTPEPHRGKRNEPAYVKYVAQKIAEIKEISVEEVERITTDNAVEFFSLQGTKNE